MQTRAILFDIDGTLLDSEETATRSLQRLLREEHGREYSYEELVPFFGYTSADTLRELGFARLPEDEFTRLLLRWEEYYREEARKAQFFPGVRELLEELRRRGLLLGVVTSKNRAELEFELASHPEIARLDVHISSDDVKRPKPAPEALLLALARLGVPASAAWYVGDTLFDQEAARAAGVRFALAGWGARSVNGFDPDAWLRTPGELLGLLL